MRGWIARTVARIRSRPPLMLTRRRFSSRFAVLESPTSTRWLTESMRVNGKPSKVVFQHRTAHGDLFVATQRNVDLGLVQPTLVDLIWSEASAVRQSRSPSESEESRDRSVDLAAWRTRDDQPADALVIDGVPAHGLTYESAGTRTTGVDLGDILVAVSGPSDDVALVRLILRG